MQQDASGSEEVSMFKRKLEAAENELRLLSRRLALLSKPVFLPDCEPLKELPHDVWCVILEDYFTPEELAAFALVCKAWAERISMILGPQLPFIRRFTIPVGPDSYWSSPIWQWNEAHWFFEVRVRGERCIFHLVCKNPGLLPVYATLAFMIINQNQTLNKTIWGCARYTREDYAFGWSRFRWDIIGDQRNGWLKEGSIEVEVKMQLIPERRFLEEYPNYVINEKGKSQTKQV